MSEEVLTSDQLKPIDWWQIVKSSIGGLNFAGIVLGSISVIRLLTAHTALTLVVRRSSLAAFVYPIDNRSPKWLRKPQTKSEQSLTARAKQA